MSRIDVESRVTIYEEDGQETKGLTLPKLTVRSHWNRSQMVVLEFEGNRITVSASDLQAAVTNPTRTGGA